MAAPTKAVTMVAQHVSSQSAPVMPKGAIVPIKATAVDVKGDPSGYHVTLKSDNTDVVRLTSATQRGNSPVGIVAVGPGVATITATSFDDPTVIGTMKVTIT